MSVTKLREMSNKYGKDPSFVLAGGGNTSYKEKDFLYIKGSGVSLAEIDESGFVKMNRAALNGIFDKIYPEDTDEREAVVLRDMMNARCEGEEHKRPSVETLLHEAIPYKYVLHVHPAMVNGMTCGKNSSEISKKLFPESVWIEPIMPGYVLAVTVFDKITQYIKDNGIAPKLLFLENHGVFIAADSVEDIDNTTEYMNKTLEHLIQSKPDFSDVSFNSSTACALAPAIRVLASDNDLGIAVFKTNAEVLKYTQCAEKFYSATTAFSPDHMVYCLDKTLFVEGDDIEEFYDNLQKGIEAYKNENGRSPKIIGIKNLGFFACGATKKEADTARDVFLDAIKVAVYAENFGGGKPMPDKLVYAINNWEVEKYRRSISFGKNANKRLKGKISIITGSAQGFGKGIAEDMAAEGAYVIIADLNGQGAVDVEKEINDKYGKGSAIGLLVNVADDESVQNMVNSTLLNYGGIDILVNNAGIVRAGSLDEMDVKSFELVTKINYTAYFLCVKYVSAVMKLQYRFKPDMFSDIIQINSKSGLSGSNKNFAYAGGKFGGIGLTQSFALELVDYNIKVNSICPGNFLGGPLWTDPEKGLFVQYLKAGKVPGAKTVDDVRRFYENKVPMRRGCEIYDVSKAIFYAVEQKYETGQAIPVTGGQVMLK